MNNFSNPFWDLTLGTEHHDSNPDGEHPFDIQMLTETSYKNENCQPNASESQVKPLSEHNAQLRNYIVAALRHHYSNLGIYCDQNFLKKIESTADAVVRSGTLKIYSVDVTDWDNLAAGSCGLALPVRHNTSHARQYLKIIPTNPNANYDFSREYEVLADADNRHDRPTNIVYLREYEVLKIDGTPSAALLLMEELEPITEPIVSYDELLQLAIDVCSGLVFLQNNQIIHRDIKPENIMRRRHGASCDYTIIDLGLMVRTDAQGRANFDGMPVSDNYAPGELANAEIGQPLYDFTTDLYMLGITLLCMVTDFDPAKREDLLSCIRTEIQSDARSDFSCEYLKNKVDSFHSERLRPASGAGVNLERIIELVCSNNPTDRPQNAITLLSWLNGDISPVAEQSIQHGTDHTEYRYPIDPLERRNRQHTITPEGLIRFDSNQRVHRSDFDYCRIDGAEHHSILAKNMGESGILINREILQESNQTVTAFDVTAGHSRYILRCINCTDPEGRDSSRKLFQNLAAYRDGLMNNSRQPCIGKIVDMMYVKYSTDQNGGYEGLIYRDNHYLFTLSETYDYELYVPLDSLLCDYGDDYDCFSVAERCAICYKVIHTMNTLHKSMIFHGNLTTKNIYVRRDPSAPNSPEVKITGFGRIDSSLSVDDKTLVHTLMSTLTNNGNIPLEILPSQPALREYFIRLRKSVEESDRTGEWFTIEHFNAWYEANYHRSSPVVYSTVSDIIRFVGNDRQPLANYNVTILKEIKSVDEVLMSNRTAPYTRLPITDEWDVDIRLFVKKDFDGFQRLYAVCLDHGDKELLVNDHLFSSGVNGEKLVDGTRIVCMRKGLFGKKKLGQITILSPHINN